MINTQKLLEFKKAGANNNIETKVLQVRIQVSNVGLVVLKMALLYRTRKVRVAREVLDFNIAIAS